jgi:hypothetical protein
VSEVAAVVYAARVLRELAVAALKTAATGGTLAATVYSPGDTSTAPEQLPAILVRSARQVKRQLALGQRVYVSHIEIELQSQLDDKDPEVAQCRIEALGLQIERVFFTDPGLWAVIEGYVEINQQIRITSDSKRHTAELDMGWVIQVRETFPPAPGVPIVSIQAIVTQSGQ